MQLRLWSPESKAGQCEQAMPGARPARLRRLAIVLLGIWLGQFALFAPSLLGRKILLPLDNLTLPRIWIPITDGLPAGGERDRARSDLTQQFEPERRFAAAELAAGRLPVWQPYQYAGVPARFTVLSPLQLLKGSIASPVVLAWAQLLVATIAGLGAYCFARSVLEVGFWAATVPAWCYPLSGALVLWQGFPLSEVICWFPWMLVTADRAVRRLTPATVGGVALTSALALLAWQIDVAGLALLATGVFGLWRIVDLWLRPRAFPAARSAVLALFLGWGGGFLLAAPVLAPILEYASTGARMHRRSVGAVERPPSGWTALPQAVLPNLYGTTQAGSIYLAGGNQPESAASAYAGALAALLVAPLAWTSRRHRSFNVLASVLIVLAMGWTVNCPGLVQLYRLPGLNLLSFNRFVFVAGFAVLAQSAIGLDVLVRNGGDWRRWYLAPALVCAVLAGWCCYRAIILPEPVATQLGEAVARGHGGRWSQDLDSVRQVQESFQATSVAGAAVCLLALGGWIGLRVRRNRQPMIARAAGLVMVAELLVFASDRNVQCDPSLYYPRIPALQQVADAEPGRIIGYNALPANLAQAQGLRDVRGYDAIDPAKYVELVSRAIDPRSVKAPYAALQFALPALTLSPAGTIQLSPILDLLGVRYVVFRGVAPVGVEPDFASPDYFVMINQHALPRAFVPRRVVLEPDSDKRLARMASPDFDPRALAYVDTAVDLPSECRGEVILRSEHATRVDLSLNMETPGLVVLGDRWDVGWSAYLDGDRVPIHCVNHALRGVVVSGVETSLEFRYEPASFRWGVIACGGFIAALSLWSIGLRRRRTPGISAETSE